MKIAIIVTEFPKITETFTMREAIELRRLGADVRIYYLTRFRSKELIHEFAKPLLNVSYGSPYIAHGRVIGELSRTVLRRPRVLAKILQTFFREFSREPALMLKSLILMPKCLRFAADLKEWGVTHIHGSFAGHPATAAWIIQQVNGTPFSFSCHAHDIFRSQAMLATKLQAAQFARVISQYNANFLAEKLGKASCRSLAIIHCGVDTIEPVIRSRDQLGVFRFLYVGSLQPRKGVDVMLRALASLKVDTAWAAQIVGDGELRRSLEELTRQLGLSDRVSFLGNRSASQVSDLYGSSDLVIVPSTAAPGGRAEGIPTVIMEALSYGCPVVASRLTGIPELIWDGVTGLLFEPGNSSELATKLKEVMNDPIHAAQMARRGRQLVEEEFSLHHNVRALFRLMSNFSSPPLQD